MAVEQHADRRGAVGCTCRAFGRIGGEQVWRGFCLISRSRPMSDERPKAMANSAICVQPWPVGSLNAAITITEITKHMPGG